MGEMNVSRERVWESNSRVRVRSAYAGLRARGREFKAVNESCPMNSDLQSKHYRIDVIDEAEGKATTWGPAEADPLAAGVCGRDSPVWLLRPERTAT